MKQELMDAIQETPVIAAVKDDDGLQNALQNENIRVVFILYGDICNISTLVQRIHAAGKFAIVHGRPHCGPCQQRGGRGLYPQPDRGRRHHLHPPVVHPPGQRTRVGCHPPGVPAGLHLAGEPGQDARQPPGLSGHPARHRPKFCAGCARTPKCRCSRAA